MKKFSFGIFAISACILMACTNQPKVLPHCAVQSSEYYDLSVNEDSSAKEALQESAVGVASDEKAGKINAN